MRSRLLQVPWVLTVVIATLVCLLCVPEAVAQEGTPGTSEARRPLEVGTFSKALSYTPLYVAKHFGWFSKEPALQRYDLRYTEYNDRPAISAALSAGQLQLLFCAEIPAIMCRAQGNDIRIVALSSVARQRVLVRSDGQVRVPADLRGTRVAVLQGTSSHFGLLKILQTAGLSERDVNLTYMPPAEARAAFESGRLDAWAVWAPFGEQEEVKRTGREVGGQAATISSVLAVPEQLRRDDPAAVDAVCKVLADAKIWIVMHSAQAQDIAASALNLDKSVVKQAWFKFNWASPLSDAMLADYQEKAEFLASLDKTRNSKVVDVARDLVVLPPTVSPGIH